MREVGKHNIYKSHRDHRQRTLSRIDLEQDDSHGHKKLVSVTATAGWSCTLSFVGCGCGTRLRAPLRPAALHRRVRVGKDESGGRRCERRPGGDPLEQYWTSTAVLGPQHSHRRGHAGAAAAIGWGGRLEVGHQQMGHIGSPQSSMSVIHVVFHSSLGRCHRKRKWLAAIGPVLICAHRLRHGERQRLGFLLGCRLCCRLHRRNARRHAEAWAGEATGSRGRVGELGWRESRREGASGVA
mmetsp:Transcript_55971/g.124957  ORF Transcript_55971/g.124957 Transcript_55971/m.124957 type:complete len:240 (+) Transcript_55971:296-1015(+)